MMKSALIFQEEDLISSNEIMTQIKWLAYEIDHKYDQGVTDQENKFLVSKKIIW